MSRRFVLVCFLLPLLFWSVEALSGPAERLAQAVRLQTISYQDRDEIDYGEFERFHQFLRQSYPAVFGRLEVERIAGYSLLLHWPGSDSSLPPILFTAHMDVVPVEPGTEQDWQHPAFAGVIDEGRVYGRGTLDDKGSLLSLLEAAEQLLVQGFRPARSIYLAFGHDEEISGRDGAAAIAERMWELGLHFSWMVDEGGMLIADNPMLPDRPMAMVNIAEKGYLTLTLVASGDGGHSSNPPQISTIGRLAGALARIEASPLPARIVAPVASMLETLAPYQPQPQRFVFDNLWLTGGFVARTMATERSTIPLVRTTTALTMFNAGIKENVVPQRAEAKVNFRLLPGDTPEMVVSHVEEVVADPRIEISYDQWDNIPGVADTQGSGFAVISKAVEAVYPEAVVVPSLLMATTDTRHYVDLVDDQYRFFGVEVAQDQTTSVHGTNEYVGVQSYLNAIEIARQMMLIGSL